ncbi:hypothetical protein U5688_000563 [Campylobacter coli]|nr:hypothetical protein [Campylobacter coli]
MVFLIPLLIIIAIIFGIDYFVKVKEEQQIHKSDPNLDKQREEYLKHLFKEKK